MKTLNFEQMEQVNGGKAAACERSFLGLGVSAIGLLSAAVAIGTGPIGWAAWGLGASIFGIGLSGVSIMNDCSI